MQTSVTTLTYQQTLLSKKYTCAYSILPNDYPRPKGLITCRGIFLQCPSLICLPSEVRMWLSLIGFGYKEIPKIAEGSAFLTNQRAGTTKTILALCTWVEWPNIMSYRGMVYLPYTRKVTTYYVSLMQCHRNFTGRFFEPNLIAQRMTICIVSVLNRNISSYFIKTIYFKTLFFTNQCLYFN